MTKKRKIFWWLAAALALAVVAFAVYWLRPRKPAFAFDPAEHRYAAVNVVASYIAMLEKPDAKTALMSDKGSELLRPYFEHAGIECSAPDTKGEFDIVVVTASAPRDWKSLLAAAGSDGALMWLMDVRETTIAAFRGRIAAFPCPDAHFWMPGETDWVLSGRVKKSEVRLADMLELFARDGAFMDLANASCDTLSDVFASFAGYRATVEPAFVGNLEAKVRPEFFVTQDVPDIPWIVSDEEVDEDIVAQNARESRSKQIVRRTVIEGNMLSREGKIDAAIGKWAGAYLHNPHDTMLLDRIYRLAVNARTFQKVGNIKAAANCYDTMIGIRPTDAAAMSEYGECMRLLGEKELSEKAFQRAKELAR
ncbi:MAG: hypothetical protein E7049_00620 [Lentisphaerae bacterium]|nr:hypothetical protein [Lentisphaerota bacterium]